MPAAGFLAASLARSSDDDSDDAVAFHALVGAALQRDLDPAAAAALVQPPPA